MSASHVRMQQVEFLGLGPVTYPTDLSRRTIHFTLKILDAGYRLLFHPAVGAAENRYLVPSSNKMLREKLTVRQRTVNVSAGDDLQDFQGNAYRSQSRGRWPILTSIALVDHINLRRRR